jgi:hypothetical protein
MFCCYLTNSRLHIKPTVSRSSKLATVDPDNEYAEGAIPSAPHLPNVMAYTSPDYSPGHPKLCNEDLLKTAVALALREPAPAFLNQHSMRLSRNSQRPYLMSSGHASRSSIASTNTICSTTPICTREDSWRSHDAEKGSITSEDNLFQAIAEDLAALEPVEYGYHRQQPFWLFSMIWCVYPCHSACAVYLLWIVRAHQIWWIIAAIANVPFFIQVLKLPDDITRTSFIAQASLINLTITVLVRNELLLVGLYWAFSKIPFRRFYPHRMLHSIGGLHVGCAFGTFM